MVELETGKKRCVNGNNSGRYPWENGSHDRRIIDILVTWDSVNLKRRAKELNEEGVDDDIIEHFEDLCTEWVENHMDTLIEDYEKFINEKVSELRKETLSEKEVQ